MLNIQKCATSKFKTHVKVDVYARTVVTLEGGSQTVESEQSAVFPCKVNADPRLEASVEVTWLKNESPLEESSSRISWDSRQLEVLATVSHMSCWRT